MNFSSFEHPHDWDNWFGTVCIRDGASVKTVRVEIQTEEDYIPEASKKTLEFFAEHDSEYREVLSEAILEYYHQRRAAWGNPPADDPLFSEITDRKQLAGMYSLLSVVVHEKDSSAIISNR